MPGELSQNLHAEPPTTERLSHAQVEQRRGAGEVLEPHDDHPTVDLVVDPKGAVVLVAPRAVVDALLCLLAGEVVADMERPHVLGEQGDERGLIGADGSRRVSATVVIRV